MLDERLLARPRVVLVSGSTDTIVYLGDALSDRVEIVYATTAADFHVSRVADAQATAVLVGVDGGDWLEAVEAALHDTGTTVVFDDPQISRTLEGWDRARWLRHMVAKLSDRTDYDPPRPGAPAATSHHAQADLDPPGGVGPAVVDADTAALSALVDAQLAQATRDDPPGSTSPWRAEEDAAAGPSPAGAVDQELPAAVAEDAAADHTAALSSTSSTAGGDGPAGDLPAQEDWQLVDPDAPVPPASELRLAEPAELMESPAAVDSGLALVPMEADVPAAVHSDPIERWLHVRERDQRQARKQQDGTVPGSAKDPS